MILSCATKLFLTLLSRNLLISSLSFQLQQPVVILIVCLSPLPRIVLGKSFLHIELLNPVQLVPNSMPFNYHEPMSRVFFGIFSAFCQFSELTVSTPKRLKTGIHSLRQKCSQFPTESIFRRYKVHQHIRKGSSLTMALNETKMCPKGDLRPLLGKHDPGFYCIVN